MVILSSYRRPDILCVSWYFLQVMILATRPNGKTNKRIVIIIIIYRFVVLLCKYVFYLLIIWADFFFFFFFVFFFDSFRCYYWFSFYLVIISLLRMYISVVLLPFCVIFSRMIDVVVCYSVFRFSHVPFGSVRWCFSVRIVALVLLIQPWSSESSWQGRPLYRTREIPTCRRHLDWDVKRGRNHDKDR